MIDPAPLGQYQCHGQMTAVELPGVYDGVSAYLCETCRKWRHRFDRTDPRRQVVNERMPLLLMSMAADTE